MTRKSPVRHTVHEYERKGHTVVAHNRGTGVRQAKPTVRLAKHKPEAFTANLKYSNKPGDGETVVVIASSYPRAIEEALEEKTDPRKPIEIELIDPTLGQALRYIGRGVGKAAGIGAKYAFKGVKAAASGTGELMYGQAQNEYTKYLIRKAYSKHRDERILARAKLKNDYPRVYDVMDFSRT